VVPMDNCRKVITGDWKVEDRYWRSNGKDKPSKKML